MGYFTYRLFREIPLEKLRAKTQANLALYEPGAAGAKVRVTAFQGDGCSALLLGYSSREEEILRPLGFQFGCVWMDVRYQDGDSWDVSLMDGTEQKANHSVNPWAHDGDVPYDQQAIDFRIHRICEAWPRQREVLRPYLLPWRMPVKKFGVTKFVPRTGKACEIDQHPYGSADQIYDFIRRFGIDERAPKVEIHG